MLRPALTSGEMHANIERARKQLSSAVGEPIDLNTAGPLTRELIMEAANLPVIAGGDHLLDQLGLDENAGIAEIGEALRKAAVTTATSADAMLDPQQARSFITAVSERTELTSRMRVEDRNSASGSIEKIGVATGKIRAASENADDGYRAEPTFGTVPYAAKGVRLPWEITLQFLRYNVEGETVEDKIWNLMTAAFAVDLERLDILGDTASGDPSLSIDDGILKLVAASGVAHRVNLANDTFGSAWPDKAHLFALADAMPDKYKQGALRADDGGNTRRPVWLMSPSAALAWTEYLTDRDTAAGDAALGASGDPVRRPLGDEIVEVPSWPNTRIQLVNPQNFVRVITDQIERYRVGPGQDWELTMRRKRGYVFFIDRDVIVEEMDAVVDGYNVGIADPAP